MWRMGDNILLAGPVSSKREQRWDMECIEFAGDIGAMT
jgi:hypothetical protein